MVIAFGRARSRAMVESKCCNPGRACPNEPEAVEASAGTALQDVAGRQHRLLVQGRSAHA
eukprot:scaffold324569_cov68-Tisochrysis_lutea.AAC.2